MKALLYAYFFILANSLREAIPEIQIRSKRPNLFLPAQNSYLGMGDNCGGTNIFHTSNFELQPYPPKPDEDLQVKATGVFLEDITITEAVVGLEYEHKLWNYYPFQYNIKFRGGDEVTFTNTIKMPKNKGKYTLNYQLNSNVHISCWEVSFSD